LDAKGVWVSEVPTLKFGGQELKFGDTWGYSVGPTASWVLFDNGARSSLKKSASKVASAQEQSYEFARKQILLQVRQSYFAVQQLLQQLVLLNGQLEVVQKQLADVESAYKAGSKSSLDVSIARKQVLKTQTAMSGARSALAGQLRTLFKLTGTDYNIDPSYPTDKRLANAKEENKTSAVLDTDPLENTLQLFRPYGQSEFDENSPKLAALDEMAQYYDYLADSYKSSLYPRVALQGGAYFEYPNGAIREHVFLGRAGAAVSVPLFEGGKDRQQAKAQKELARAKTYEKQDTQETLTALFLSAKDRLYGLQVQENLLKDTIKQTRETARLTYQAYKAGAVTFFEVDRANLDLLESQLSLADVQVEQLNQLAILNSLSKETL
ncbi:MAG: TolC family protein, partial [Elusimicrobiaceae bacterium]|nr:TolC family protein [Elusimicrobiaceae bacterium]